MAKQILSVCMMLPTQSRPQQGLFVYRRLRAMSKLVSVRALRPQPWFPGLRAGSIDKAIDEAEFPMDGRRMFYLPGVAKSLDGRWMARCVTRWLDELATDPTSTVLDAHFGYPEGVACHLAAKSRGLPFFVTLRGVEEEWFLRSSVRGQMRRALNEATGVIAVSESLRLAAVKSGVDPQRIHVIGNGCDATIFRSGSKAEARERLGIHPATKLLVCVANIKHVKGHDRLLAAMTRLKASLDFQLICIGNRHEQAAFARAMEKRASETNLSGHVRFVGSLAANEIADHLRAADAFVLASRREGCCNAILEALACGVPVVATAVGNCPELARRYSGIQLADAEDPESFSNAILAAVRGESHLCAPERVAFQPKSWDDVACECLEWMHERCVDNAGLHGSNASGTIIHSARTI